MKTMILASFDENLLGNLVIYAYVISSRKVRGDLTR